jgi:hypothetical protein
LAVAGPPAQTVAHVADHVFAGSINVNTVGTDFWLDLLTAVVKAVVLFSFF